MATPKRIHPREGLLRPSESPVPSPESLSSTKAREGKAVAKVEAMVTPATVATLLLSALQTIFEALNAGKPVMTGRCKLVSSISHVTKKNH